MGHFLIDLNKCVSHHSTEPGIHTYTSEFLWKESFQLNRFQLYLDVWYTSEVFQTDTDFDCQLEIQNNICSPGLVHKFPGWYRCHGRRRRASPPSTLESSKACSAVNGRKVMSNFSRAHVHLFLDATDFCFASVSLYFLSSVSVIVLFWFPFFF